MTTKTPLSVYLDPELMRALAVGVVTWETAGHILYFVAMSAVGIWFTSRRLGALFLR